MTDTAGIPELGRRMGAAELASTLRAEILAGRYEPRDRLPSERRLAETHGVARGTVRSALEQLACEGQLEVRPGSGAYVCARTDSADAPNSVVANARPLELIDARFALEPHICRLAVLHARQQDIDAAEQLLETMELSVDDADGFAEADMVFHRLLAESTGNSLLIWMVAQVSNVRDHDQWARMRGMVLDPETIRAYNRQHRAIVDAIRARDPEMAANTMKEHLSAARLALTRASST